MALVGIVSAGHRFQCDDPKVERMMTLLNKWAALSTTSICTGTGFSRARLLWSISSRFGESSATSCPASTPGVGLSGSCEACSG